MSCEKIDEINEKLDKLAAKLEQIERKVNNLEGDLEYAEEWISITNGRIDGNDEDDW